MKRKYLAIMMGMVLSLTSMNVYAVSAAETDTTTESAEASTEETAEEELTEDASGADSELDELANAPEVIGQVTDVSEESMMISVGTLSGEETTAAAETTEEEDAEEVTDAPEEEAAAETTASQTLTLNGQAMEVYLDDTITFQKETNPAEITVEEASEEELTESEAAEEAIEETTEAETEEKTTETTEAAAEAEPADASEELEKITISDIKVGDIVKILSDENGQVTSIIVLAEGELTDAQEEETAETTEETADETAEDGSVEETTEETAE